MKNEDCVFCVFSNDQKIKVWEDDLFFAIYDSFPVSPGHTLIVPKRHVVNFESLSSEEWKDLRFSVNTLIKINMKTDFKRIYEEMLINSKSENSTWFLKKVLANLNLNAKPQAYNYGVNDGTAAGRTVDHFHWHIIPRYEGDVDDPRGGVRYVIPALGNYKTPRSSFKNSH